MANTVVTPCLMGIWTKVATNVTTGFIHILDNSPSAYYQTYRTTGGAAPTGLTEAVKFDGSMEIKSSIGIDIYVWAQSDIGSVRVDT